MAFEVHPHAPANPPIDPLSITPSDQQFTTFTQITGPDTVSGIYAKTMFIRVAVYGTPPPTAPSLSLKCGVGAEVIATTVAKAVSNGPNVTDQIADVQILASSVPNVQLLRIGFYDNTAETWQLGIRNNDVAQRDFTWVVASTANETLQPWIALSAPTMTITSLVNRPNEVPNKILKADSSVQVANKGTGPLNVNALSPVLPVTLETVGGPPFTVAPGTSADLVIRFTPPSAGPSQLNPTLTLTSTPPDPNVGTTGGHNGTLQIHAVAQRLEVVLLLDDSGSMGTDALGDVPASPATSRWGELRSAANLFLDLLAFFGADRGKFGIARFPATDANNPSTYDLVPMTDITTSMAAAQASTALTPFNSTPMGDGLFRVLGPTSYFSTDQLNRRWLLLMSDGAHNSGSHQPAEFLAPLNGTNPLDDRDISLFAVAYGIDGHTDVNHVLLKDLASGSQGGGQFRAVQQEGVTASDLSLALRDAIKSGLTAATSPLDPTGVFLIGPGERRHEVLVTDYDHRAAFVLTWNTPKPERLHLELITPGNGRITPQNAGTGRYADVVYKSDDRSATYLVDADYLRGGGSEDDDGTSAAGTWTFVITSPGEVILSLAAGAGANDGLNNGLNNGRDTETYVYDTIVESSLKVEVSTDRDTYFAGDRITVSARLTVEGRPIHGAAVSMSTTKPAESFANWLARAQVPASALAQARDRLAGKDASPLLVKQLGAQIAGLTFGGGIQQTNIPMTEQGEAGIYSAVFRNTSVPEHYTFYVTAFGVTDEGTSFRREGKQETYVQVRPDPQFTHLDITTISPGVLQVTAIPQDQFGNVLLIDPSMVTGFSVVAPDTKVGELVSGLDGTYTSTVTFNPDITPEIVFQAGGLNVVKPVRAHPLDTLTFTDNVVAFTPGGVVGASKHPDTKALLGTVATKVPDMFTSLGGGGNVVVGVTGSLILAKAEEDVTVFVAPQADRRSYQVDAFSMVTGDWVELGRSIGTTMSFSLAEAGLKFTPAIRITDASGQIRDENLKPLSEPGVGIRGVGFLATTVRMPDGDWNWPHWWDRGNRGRGGRQHLPRRQDPPAERRPGG